MLEDLTIKDFAIIKNNSLEFKNGFTVLSGETGAGKSILIGALSFLLGGKAETSMIRGGEAEASVSGTFYIPKLDETEPEEGEEPANAGQWLKAHGIEAENNRVLLRRIIRSNGKSAAWIDSTPVTRTDLAEFSAFLIDIHGQHEHQSLMKVTEHRKFLDGYAGVNAEVEDFTKYYAALVEKRKVLQSIESSEGERARKIDMFNFAVNEIEKAKLKKDEDVELENEQSRLSSFERIFSSVSTINQVLSESDESVLPALKKLKRESAVIAELDKSAEDLDKRLESVFYDLSDLSDEFSSYASKLTFDPQRLSDIQERLSLIYNLKKKYASSVNAPLSEVFDYLEQAKAYLDLNADGNGGQEKLKAEIAELEKTVLQKATVLSKKRRDAAGKMSSEIEGILQTLGMKQSKFEVSISQKSGTEVVQKCGPYGIDNIEFLISSNPGSPVLPLAKIASGGELSRVMLALKTIFAETDPVDTLIFDEIDTGIGGEIAVNVGGHLKNLAKNRQILCITHLASIAVYADNQIKIEKGIENGITSSHVHEIQGEERVVEIARMLSGDADTEMSREHARTLLAKYSS
ncbi:MAG: DNA repair protein RecN [Treponema sp.]|nr:DNA repair protein RecN [Treponema sp.]